MWASSSTVKAGVTKDQWSGVMKPATMPRSCSEPVMSTNRPTASSPWLVLGWRRQWRTTLNSVYEIRPKALANAIVRIGTEPRSSNRAPTIASVITRWPSAITRSRPGSASSML